MHHRQVRGRELGVSLSELTVVLAIVGIATGVALIRVDPVEARADAAARRVVSELRRARSAAVTQQNDHLVQFGTDVGFDVLDDRSNDGDLDLAAGESRTSYTLGSEAHGIQFGFVSGIVGPDGSSITTAVSLPGSPPSVTFDARGVASSGGTIFVIPAVDQAGGSPDRMRAVTVAAVSGQLGRWRYDASALDEGAPGPWRRQ